MAIPKGAKTGYDYSATRQTHNSSDLQKRDNNTYQTISNLIDGAIAFQGFVNNEFPQLDGSTSSLFNAVKSLIEEVNNRNNSKYSISLTNTQAQTIANGDASVVTFDEVIFDDGLMFDPLLPSQIKLNVNGQFMISGRVTFCAPLSVYCKITVNLNGVPQFNSAIQGSGKTILPFVGLIEALRNDIITVTVTQDGNFDIDIAASFQAFRVTYVTHKKAVGRNEPATLDADICGDDGDGTGCDCEGGNLGLIVVPEAERTYLLTPEGRVYKQSDDVIDPDPVNQVVCMIGLKNGLLLRLRDNDDTGFSRLEFVDPDTLEILKTVELDNLYGSANGSHCLLELPCLHILTVIRATGQVIELDATDGSIQRILGLTLTDTVHGSDRLLDGTVNRKGSRLLYCVNPSDGSAATLECWDLVNDVHLCTIFTSPSDFYLGNGFLSWPIWLNNCQILLAQGQGWLGDNDIIRISKTGTVVKRITYDHSTFAEGLYGIAANVSLNRVWAVGDWDNRPNGSPHFDEEPATLIFNMATGAQIGNVVPFNIPDIEDASDLYGSVTQGWFPVPCTACNDLIECGGGVIPSDIDGGDPGCVHCDESSTPVNTNGPSWYVTLTDAVGVCFTQEGLASMLSSFNSNGYSLQNQERGDLRPRGYLGYPVPDFSKYVDLTAGCGWTWVQHGF